ncbi:MAG: chemotaxis protein CheB [Ktedonobacteraceae bacterium]|nr:chemotaxis protein CheB [Ktedonobacteraceae bacterium]
MSGHEIIVVGASAGGVEALVRLVREFPADLAGSVFVVLHIPAQSPSLLPDILNRAGQLKAQHPVDHQHIEGGHIYVAPPDHHLLIERGLMRIVRGPKENRHRPAVDPLFRSAAVAYGPQVVGVVLTGSLDDGTAGLLAIKQRGGIAIVQDPDDAIYPDMPRSALTHVNVDYCLPIADIGPLLVQLAREKVVQGTVQPASEDMEREVRVAEMETNPLNEHEQVGAPSAYSCPECGGVLWEVHDGELSRFRCRVGHAFSSESMLSEQSERIEEALWVALKTLDENASLSRRMAKQAQQNGHAWLMERLDVRVKEAEQQAALLRRVLAGKEASGSKDIDTIS